MCEEDNIANRTRQFARDFLSLQTAYYTHKGTLSHACLVLQMAIFAWIMGEDGWAIIRDRNLLVFIILWGTPYIYVRWELRKRRFSAIMVAATAKALREWVTNDPVAEELQSQETNQSPKTENGGLRLRDYTLILLDYTLRILDLITPLPLFLWFFPADYMKNCMGLKDKTGKYTAPLSKVIQDTVKKRRLEFYFDEYLVSVASCLLCSIVFYRRFTDC